MSTLYSMLEAATEEGKEDAFICELYSTACLVLWFELKPETWEHIERRSREIRDHLEGRAVYKKINAAP